MRTLIAILLWFLLFAICWPLALIFLFLFPVLWLLLLPFRIIGFTLDAVVRLIGALFMLPFRMIKSI